MLCVCIGVCYVCVNCIKLVRIDFMPCALSVGILNALKLNFYCCRDLPALIIIIPPTQLSPLVHSATTSATPPSPLLLRLVRVSVAFLF